MLHKSERWCIINIMINSGIYEIKNLVNNKFYIGSTKNFINRKRKHFSELKTNKHGNKQFLQEQLITYIGNKRKLLSFIEEPILISFDQSSSTSGWAIYVVFEGVPNYHSSGTLTRVGSPETALALDTLISTACSLGGPVQAILEDHKCWGHRTAVAALSRSTGAILQALGSRSIQGRSIHYATPAEWRPVVLGISGTVDRQTSKQAALTYAKTIDKKIVSSDQAEAVCLATYLFSLLYNK